MGSARSETSADAMADVVGQECRHRQDLISHIEFSRPSGLAENSSLLFWSNHHQALHSINPIDHISIIDYSIKSSIKSLPSHLRHVVRRDAPIEDGVNVCHDVDQDNSLSNHPFQPQAAALWCSTRHLR